MNDEAYALTALVAAPLALAGLERWPRWNRPGRVAFGLLLVVLSLGFAVGIADEARDNLREPPEWDYLGFWLYAQTAERGDDFYDPAQAAASAADLEVSRAFRREVLDTGFWYPPPSMFLFYPLAGLAPGPGLVLWYALMFALAAVSVWLAWRIFFPGGGLIELATVGLVVVSSRPTLSNVYFCQTTFAGLVLLLLFWRDRERATGGMWLALAFFVKPLFAPVGLPLLARARWKAIGTSVGSMAALSLASMLAFSLATFVHYFTREGAAAKPEWIFREPTNQSLLGFALRASASRCEGWDCVTFPWYLGPALAVAAITLPLAWRLARSHDEWSISLCLLSALLVYPVSQPFYAIVLVAPLLLLWRERARFQRGAPLAAALAGLVQGLGWIDGGKLTVVAVALLWAATAGLGWRLARTGEA